MLEHRLQLALADSEAYPVGSTWAEVKRLADKYNLTPFEQSLVYARVAKF